MKRDVRISIDVESLVGAINDGAKEGLVLGTNIVAEDAKGRAPQHTGALVNSIEALPPEGNLIDGEVTAIVSAGAPHAIYVEFGTGIHGPKSAPIWVEPRQRKALRFPAPGGQGFVFSRGHWIDGMEAQPFLVPALEENADTVADVIADAIELAVDEAGD